ncbi:hypothetical protein CEUSTIGMA_g1833.t1 [Chlamydomonas eustigma]|uniref:MYND-type domain-containing protein n=1 Tax=Chlamydomonas eustigma TaxID=1157962 RepID=A0A250WUB1_9CHLO|nr:hypothetical protein CEUSTIGMA_g1833.t1 [Chlamydomonas eustigma]|eukprot:GAX74385.1 hypothetical protein CEUSTIGMA_g1833.t1 [Chlamydomonas eustigma]
METYFSDPLPYWVSERAAVTSVHASHTWPPSIVANGLAPGFRAWKPLNNSAPNSKGEGAVNFEPVTAVCELDGLRKSCVAMHGDIIATGDASSEGLVSIWDAISWKRVQTLKVGSPVCTLQLNDEYLAAGTANGTAHVWQRVGSTVTQEWRPLSGASGLSVCSVGRSCDILKLAARSSSSPQAGGRGDEGLLVSLNPWGYRVSVWKLPACRLITSFARAVTEETAEALAVEANVQFSFLEGSSFVTVSWAIGKDPVIQVMDVVAKDSNILQAPDRLVGRGRPLSADFQGRLLAVGFEDGAVAVFGYRGWLRWHGGAVGAVKVMPERMQVISGGADGEVKLWIEDGSLLWRLKLGLQVSALAVGSIFAVAGGAAGEVQLMVLMSEEDSKQHITMSGSGSGCSGLPPSKEDMEACNAQPTASDVKQYTWYFDSRLSKAAAGADAAVGGKGVAGAVADHPDQYRCFAGPERVPVTSDDLLAASAAASSSGGASQQQLTPEERERKVAELAEEKRRQQLAQMGEDRGVARSSGVVSLESNTSRMGRKCDSNSCLNREGLGKDPFKRCGACKSVWYCSQHCQRTHFRDGHKAACHQLAEEWRKSEREKLPTNTNTSTVSSTPAGCSTVPQPSHVARPIDQGAHMLNLDAVAVTTTTQPPPPMTSIAEKKRQFSDENIGTNDGASNSVAVQDSPQISNSKSTAKSLESGGLIASADIYDDPVLPMTGLNLYELD